MSKIIPSLIHVLVIAHPDDESMFFLPWINYIINACHRNYHEQLSVLWLLCLTTGNYDGLGQIRSQELYKVNTNVLHDGFNKVIILDEPNIIPDHPTQRWNVPTVSQQIHKSIQSALHSDYGPNSIPSAINLVTFDEKGVSGHVNHIDTFYAVQHLYHHHQQQLSLLASSSQQAPASPSSMLLASETMTVWTLKTIRNPIAKYVPFCEWIRLILHFMYKWYDATNEMGSYPDNNDSTNSEQSMMKCRLLNPVMNWYAMSTHASQFVWYRRLFVVFSKYTYHNTFYKIEFDDMRTTTTIDASISQPEQSNYKKEL